MFTLFWQKYAMFACRFRLLARISFPTLLMTIMLISLAACTVSPDTSLQALAERSAIVVRGKILKVNASAEPVLAASDKTIVIQIQQMYSGDDIAGDQTGHIATVILHLPRKVKVGDEFMFFGNPRFLGKTLTITDKKEIAVSKSGTGISMSEIKSGIQARKDRPILNRLATANLVFRGTVEGIQPLADQKVTAEPRREHDPEWQIARVRIVEPIRGGVTGHKLIVIFSSSRNILWFSAPKLKVGEDAVFIAHLVTKKIKSLPKNRSLAALKQKQPVYLVTQAADVLPVTALQHVRHLITRTKETNP